MFLSQNPIQFALFLLLIQISLVIQQPQWPGGPISGEFDGSSSNAVEWQEPKQCAQVMEDEQKFKNYKRIAQNRQFFNPNTMQCAQCPGKMSVQENDNGMLSGTIAFVSECKCPNGSVNAEDDAMNEGNSIGKCIECAAGIRKN